MTTVSKIIETTVIGWRGDPARLTDRAYELWRWHWLMQDHLPARPATREPTRSFIGSWRE